MFCMVALLEREMIEVLGVRLPRESVDVLWRSRFLTRSRASSNAAADDRFALEVEDDAEWIKGGLLEADRASSAL